SVRAPNIRATRTARRGSRSGSVSHGRTRVLLGIADHQAGGAELPVLPQRGNLRAQVDGAQEEGSPAARRRRPGPRQVRQGAKLHGAPRRQDRLQESALPPSLRHLRRQNDGIYLANPGLTPGFRRTLPETGCLLGWTFGPRNFMKNCPSGDGALRGLTRLPWISGAFCRKFAGSPVCPRFPEPGPRIGFSTLSKVGQASACQSEVDAREPPIRAAAVRERMACHVISQRSPAQRAPRRGSVWQY